MLAQVRKNAKLLSIFLCLLWDRPDDRRGRAAWRKPCGIWYATFERDFCLFNEELRESFFRRQSEEYPAVLQGLFWGPDWWNSVCQFKNLPTVNTGQKFYLSWSHYLKLMRINNIEERHFYEIELIKNAFWLIQCEGMGYDGEYMPAYSEGW